MKLRRFNRQMLDKRNGETLGQTETSKTKRWSELDRPCTKKRDQLCFELEPMRTVPQRARQPLAACISRIPNLSFLIVVRHVDGVQDLLIYAEVDGFRDHILVACEPDGRLSNHFAHSHFAHVASISGMGREGDGEAHATISTV